MLVLYASTTAYKGLSIYPIAFLRWNGLKAATTLSLFDRDGEDPRFLREPPRLANKFP